MKIVFCHNVYVRHEMLRKTIEIEKRLFPDSISIVAYNDTKPPVIDGVEYIYFSGITHKIGCTNGCITSIKAALKYNPDVIVFSHDDVFINEDNLDIVINRLKEIVNGNYDVICRMPGNSLYGNDYFLMECFYLSPKAAKLCFENTSVYDDENKIPRDIRGSISPEVFLFNILQNNDLKYKIYEYEHKLEGYNDTLQSLMGFHHFNAGQRGWI